MDDRTDPGCKQFHLLIFIASVIIKVKKLWAAVFCNGRLNDRHKIYKSIVKKDINADNEAAGIINHRNDIYPVFLTIVSF